LALEGPGTAQLRAVSTGARRLHGADDVLRASVERVDPVGLDNVAAG